MSRKRILITGAAGFIGFHLIRALKKLDFDIIGVDNFNDYYDLNLKVDRVRVLGFNEAQVLSLINGELLEINFENVILRKNDLADRQIIKTLFDDFSFDLVINLGAQAGVRYSIQNPNSYADSNLVGFLNILEGCRNTHVKHLIYASSSSVYGNNPIQPFGTSDRVDHPISLYAATKKSNELMAHAYSHLYNLPTTGLRFFTVYGPWGRPDMAYFSFTKKILNGEPIDVYNNGELLRDFTYVDDVIEGICKLIEKSFESKDSGINVPYKIYNIGNNQPVSLRRFISAIELACERKAVENLLPMQLGDVYATYADIDDLINDTGFRPNTSIESGITKFVDWYKSYYMVNEQQ